MDLPDVADVAYVGRGSAAGWDVAAAHPSVGFHRGAAAISRVAAEYGALRARLGQHEDVLTSLDWFLAQAARSNWLPVLALVRSGGVLRGAVLLHGRRAYGVSTGIYKSGELCGRGGVVGDAAEGAGLAEAAAYALVRRGITHTVLVTLLHPGVAQLRTGSPAERACGQSWHVRPSYSRLSLAGGLDGVLSRFTYKMRRNFRYYRKKAEGELGCRCLPALLPGQDEAAIDALRLEGRWPSARSWALARGRAIRAVPDGFSMGIQDRLGHWASFLAGWRHRDRTFVEWQLNRTEVDGMSFSTAMRNYLVEHEAARGAREVVFVGETVGGWQRACLPDLCGDLLVTRDGLLGKVAQEVGRALKPEGQVARLRRKPGSAFGPAGPAPDPSCPATHGGPGTPDPAPPEPNTVQ